MRFNTWSTLTNTFIFSAVARLCPIPTANAKANNTLEFAAPGGPGSDTVYLNYTYTVVWYVSRGEAER
jgi:hypothetical protein